MKNLTFALFFLFSCLLLNAQQWEQVAGEPEGGGITDIYYNESTADLFVSAGSLDWPNGEEGGLRRSTDDGNTWENIFDAYTSRFIMQGPDDNLYASVWDYPDDEGLYRSTDNGNTWTLLTSVPTGNNIFACAIKEDNTNIIFAGTGEGVYRSFDNGVTWAYANTGLPADKLVRSMAVSPDGSTIAAGTVNGLYVSSDNGDNWDQVTGDGEGEIVTSLLFDVDPENKSETRLYAGTETGLLLVTTAITLYTVATLIATIMPSAGVTRLMALRHPSTFVPIFMASLWAASGGGFFLAVGGATNWLPWMNGLPPGAIISMFTSTLVITTAVFIVMYIAMYGNSKGEKSGCEIYKANYDIATSVDLQPFNSTSFQLDQNFPNPFKDQTWINFKLSNTGSASLKIFDLAGKEIKSVVDGVLSSGRHSYNVTKEGLTSGIYYYVLQSGNLVQTKKLVIQ